MSGAVVGTGQRKAHANLREAGIPRDQVPPLFHDHAAITHAFSELEANLGTVMGPVITGLNASMSLAGNYTAGSVVIKADSTASFAMGNINIEWKNGAGEDRKATLRFSGGPNLMEVMAETPTHKTAFKLAQLFQVGQFLVDPSQFSDANPRMVVDLSRKSI